MKKVLTTISQCALVLLCTFIGYVVGRHSTWQERVPPYYVMKPHMVVGQYMPAKETYDCSDQASLHVAQKMVKYCFKKRISK